jgi:bifunctional DNA-binding transcriptional regulator/antitoxin component of YhaV-PrlF toxin-antitoxin module
MEIDLEIALRKLHELQKEDGDLGSEYWLQISKLLKEAASYQERTLVVEEKLRRLQAGMTTSCVVRTRGRITLPPALRLALGLEPGMQLSFSRLRDGTVVMRVRKRKCSDLAGILTREDQPTVTVEEMSR